MRTAGGSCRKGEEIPPIEEKVVSTPSRKRVIFTILTCFTTLTKAELRTRTSFSPVSQARQSRINNNAWFVFKSVARLKGVRLEEEERASEGASARHCRCSGISHLSALILRPSVLSIKAVMNS